MQFHLLFLLVHLLCYIWSSHIENFKPEINSLKYFNSGNNVNYELLSDGLKVNLEESEIEEINTILVLEL